MTGAEFSSKYRLLRRITNAGVSSYHAQNAVTNQAAMVHIFQNATVSDVKSQLDELDRTDRDKIIELVEVDGSAVVVSQFILGFRSFEEWIEERHRAARPAGSGAPTTTAPPGSGAPPPIMPSDAPGEFTQLFQSATSTPDSGRAPSSPAAAPSPASAAAPRTRSPQGGAPPVTPLPPLPAAPGPGGGSESFTQLFAGGQSSSAGAGAPPGQPPAPIQAPSSVRPVPPVKPAPVYPAAPVQPPAPPPPPRSPSYSPNPEGSFPPSYAPQAPPSTQPPPSPPPRAPSAAPPVARSAAPPEPRQEPGSFTQMFLNPGQGGADSSSAYPTTPPPFRGGPGGAAAPPDPPLSWGRDAGGLPPALQPPQQSSPLPPLASQGAGNRGSFTELLNTFSAPPGQQAGAPAMPPPMPPMPQPPAGPSAHQPSEFTRIVNATPSSSRAIDGPGSPPRAHDSPGMRATPREPSAAPGRAADAAAAEKKMKSFVLMMALAQTLFTLLVAMILFFLLRG